MILSLIRLSIFIFLYLLFFFFSFFFLFLNGLEALDVKDYSFCTTARGKGKGDGA